ncbi:hypothetical protein Tco_1496188, partial [Tanacetum coccineum]
SKPSTAKPPKPKPAKEKSTKATPLQKADKGKVAKVHNVKSSFQLVDEPDEEPTQPKPEHQGEGDEYDMEQATRPLPVVEGKGKAIDDTSANIVRNSSSPADAETGAESDKTNSRGDTEILQITEELGEDVDKQVNLEEKTAELDLDQARSNPGETYESRPPPEQVFLDKDQARPDPRESSVALVRPDPDHTHDEFMTNLYPKVQESLKFLADEHVILEDPLSSTMTLSLMKNLEDAYTIWDCHALDLFSKNYYLMSLHRCKTLKPLFASAFYFGPIRRSKDFMEVIERRLKIRRIFRSLESFVGGRLRDADYRLIQRTE